LILRIGGEKREKRWVALGEEKGEEDGCVGE